MKIFSLFAVFLLSFNCNAQQKFEYGPVFSQYGKHVKVHTNPLVNKDSHFKVVFDVAEISGENVINRRFDSLARFINMHVANGVPLENIDLALVVHGKAGVDLLNHAAYKARFGQQNPNGDLIEKLLANRVKIFLCGQSAAYQGIANEQLITEVQMALSAMTANALLSQQGYTHNPF
ncbi:DsrE family protein [Aliiglaciecola sp. LCG003]|uniref:DsrE family protein n=1 Tax=Aliiglaciecola sp. LCG003 TaxID=3053655 RepID=UPI0025746C8B|nr:DsrE family protein [Aliiglaciecola sp. LCG003]WJG09621.1 DsrE family protein [Aliiglaciecola sp. LCG003]